MAGGRQCQFDKQEALKNAMFVFWKKGFVGASLSDLTASMGINKPSLYAAFGNKEQLFIRATDYYIDHYAKPHLPLLHTKDKSLRQRLTDYVMSIVAMQCDTSTPGGCFISLCVNETAGESLPVDALAMINKASKFSERYLIKFLKSEQQQGNLSQDIVCQTLALYILTLSHGTAAMKRSGKSLSQIQSVVQMAMGTVKL